MEREFKKCPKCKTGFGKQIKQVYKTTKLGEEEWRILKCKKCNKKFKIFYWLNPKPVWS